MVGAPLKPPSDQCSDQDGLTTHRVPRGRKKEGVFEAGARHPPREYLILSRLGLLLIIVLQLKTEKLTSFVIDSQLAGTISRLPMTFSLHP